MKECRFFLKKCGLYEKINNIHLKFYRTKRGIVMIRISGMKLKLKDRDIKKAVMAELRIKETSIKNITNVRHIPNNTNLKNIFFAPFRLNKAKDR